MKLAAIQHDIVWQDPAATHDLVAPMIAEAADDGARLIVLSEMFATGFSMNVDAIAQSMDGPSVSFLVQQADRCGSWVAGSVAIRENGLVFNRFVAASPSGELVTYDKRHPFSFAGENAVFERGDDLVTFEIEGLRVSPTVCYDLRFGDDYWALGPTTDVFLVVANWPEPRRAHWSNLLVARAIENQCYVVGVNRIGLAKKLNYTGDSAIIGPFGETLAAASHRAAVLSAEVTSDEVYRIRTEFPFLQDRR